MCCKEPVDPKQLKAGKAYCFECEGSIFGNEKVESPSPFLKRPKLYKDIRKGQKKMEETMSNPLRGWRGFVECLEPRKPRGMPRGNVIMIG